MIHGTRRTYQRDGCRCTPCRAANAAYWRSWHQAKVSGRPLLGARISAVEAHRLIKVIRAEWETREALAKALGRHHDLARLTQQRTISLRMLLKIRRLYRRFMVEPLLDTGAPPHELDNR